VDHNGIISFDEFLKYYNGLQEFVKDKLTKDNLHMHVLRKFHEECVEAASYRRKLGHIVRKQAGLLSIENSAGGSSHQIEVRFTPACVTAHNTDKWVRVTTMLEGKIDYYQDNTDVLGEVFSPAVRVEFEEGLELEDEFTVRFPHCFAGAVSKSDVVIAYAPKSSSAWEEVDPECYQIVEGSELTGMLPTFLVTMVDPGTLCAFSRAGANVAQRVRCFGFLPPEIIPLETELLRLYITRDLPTELVMLHRHEEHERGLVCVVGCSNPFDLSLGASVDLQVKTINKNRP